MISRRCFLTGALMAGPALLRSQAMADDRRARLQSGLVALERRHGGRLGVAILDTQDMTAFAQRGDERFPMGSTFKFLAAGLVLARVDRKQEDLARRIVYAKSDLVTYSPVTEKHVGEPGLSVGEICDAAVTLSDNTAGNLLLDSFGGPQGLTAFLRTLGDNVSRLDRRETALNEATPGDPRDTTTPLAMVGLMDQLLLGSALTPASREQLAAWLIANKTGDKRIRAGVPKDWRVGDKTGTSGNGVANDVAIIWPPQRAPILVAAYYAEAEASSEERNAVHAEVGRLATSA
jgi:beta-lactamase class A